MQDTPKDLDKKRADEKLLVSEMIALYCRRQHKTPKGTLCPECRQLHDYALMRIDKCPFMETKTFCSACRVHCSVTLIWGSSHLQPLTLWLHSQTSQVTPMFSIFITSLPLAWPAGSGFILEISSSLFCFALRPECDCHMPDGQHRVHRQHPGARPAHHRADLLPHGGLVAVHPAG